MRRPRAAATPPTTACTTAHARRRRHVRVADGAGAVGAPRRASMLRAATTSACTSRSTASTRRTAGVRSPTPRRCCRATAASRATSTTCGSTPTRRRCCASAGPRSSGPLAWGIDVTHLAPHLTAITLRPEFFDVYLDLAVEFRLPIRLPSTITAEQAGFPFRRLAAEEGVLFPDHFDHDWRAGSRERVYARDPSTAARRHRDPRPTGDRHARGAGHHRARRRLDRRPRAGDRRPARCATLLAESAPC